MKTKFFLAVSILGLAAVSAGSAQGQAAKQLRVVEAVTPIELKVSPLRPSYAIGAPISLQIETSKPAFVYVYTRGNDGKSTMFNIGGLASATPQPAGKSVLANAFSADAAGDEELVIFATEERLKLPGADALNAVVTRVLESQLAELGVSVGPKARAAVRPGFSEPAITVLKIDGPAPATVTASAGMPMLNSSKAAYKVGEEVQIFVGSSAKGQIQVFVRDGRQAPVALASLAFDAPGVKTIKATAAPPAGQQTIIAVHSADGKVTVEQLAAAGFGAEAAGEAAKGLSLRPAPAATAPLAIDTHVIKIED